MTPDIELCVCVCVRVCVCVCVCVKERETEKETQREGVRKDQTQVLVGAEEFLTQASYSQKSSNGAFSPNEFNENIIYLQNNLDLGDEWRKHFRKIRQTSKGNDISAEFIFRYSDDQSIPQFAKLDIKVKDKNIVSGTFENLDHLSTKTFSTSDNAAILNKWAAKVGLSTKKKGDLLSEMAEDENLVQLIHADPELNIKRWLNTRNHVDKTKLAKTL